MESKNKGFAFLGKFAKKRKGKYILSVVLAILSVVSSMVPYYAISNIVIVMFRDDVKDMTTYMPWIIVILVATLMRVIFHNLSTVISHKATFAVISDIRREVADKLVKVPMGYVLGIPSGTLKSTIVDKADSTEPILAHAVPEMTSSILAPLMIILYIFVLDWRMGLATLITTPIGFACFRGMMKDYEPKFKEMSDVSKRMNSVAIEYVNGIEVIKAFSQSASSYAKYKNAVKENAEYGLNWMKSVQTYFALALGIWPSILIGVLPIGSLLYANGSLSAGVFITVIVLSMGVFGPILAGLSFVDDLAMVNTIMEDIVHIISEPPMKRPETHTKLNSSNVTIKDVSFSYDDREVLHNINLEFKEGEVIALVGPSGGGKSTIAKLIASFWDVQKGSISIGGKNVKDIPFEQLNEKIAYVSQNNFLFNETIFENIRKGNSQATDEDIKTVAKQSGCHEFIESLENGYHTVVGAGGGHLSSGERQRITIARAMLKNSDIIILDEATAYTDPENEAVIQEAVSKLAKNKTLIVIAHRLSTIVDSDRICVIDEGNVVGAGKFEDLMNSCALFKRMWLAHESVREQQKEAYNA